MPRRLGGKRLERVNGRLVEVPNIGPDREPQPSDGPDYHAEHEAWVRRQVKASGRTTTPGDS